MAGEYLPGDASDAGKAGVGLRSIPQATDIPEQSLGPPEPQSGTAVNLTAPNYPAAMNEDEAGGG